MSIKKGDQLGNFTIEKPLSQTSGMSTVYLAHVTDRPQYKAAIKVNLTDQDHSHTYQDLVRRETVFLTQMRHPNIVRIFPLELNGIVAYIARAPNHPHSPWYYAMEYLPHGSLENQIKTVSKYPLLWQIELFYQLVIAVHYMHQKGYAHCDLKPQNILFRYPLNAKEIPIPVLIDFGSIAQNNQIEQLTASVRYSAPEVLMHLQRKEIPLRSLIAEKIDVWALGAILFEILTGRPLYNQEHKSEITTTILRGEIQSVKSYRPEVSDHVDTLLTLILQPNPTKRLKTANVIEAIEELIPTVRPPRLFS